MNDEVFNPAGLESSEDIGSRLVAALEYAYTEIRCMFDNGVPVQEYKSKPPVIGHIPPAVIVINSSASKYGHYSRSRWRHGNNILSEIMISAEGLKRSPRDVLGTILHEAVHGICHTAGVQDVSNNNKYHNKAFRRTAEEIGLIVHDPVKVHGHTVTELPEGEYEDILRVIEPQLVAYREFDTASQTPPRSDRELSLRCRCPRKIRIFQTIRDEGPIVCGVCGDEFE